MTFINPKFCIFFTFIVFLISFFIPSDFFYSVVGEKNHSFLNIESLFYISLCVLFFSAGMRAFSFLPKEHVYKTTKKVLSTSSIIFLLSLCNIINALITYNIFSKNKALIISTFVFGDSAKILMTDTDLGGTFSSLTITLSALSLWCYYRADTVKKNKFLINLLVLFAFIIALSKPLLFMSRLGIMSTLSGYAAIFMFHKYKKGQSKAIFFYALLLATIVIGVFISVSFLRAGSENADNSALLKNLFGYTIVSYSHLGALLEGTLKYYDPGFGYYIFTFLRDIPLIGDSIASFFGWGDPYSIWLREFQDSWRAGLNGDLIWLTGFGYVFVSLGWFSVFFFFIYGFFMKCAWHSFINGKDFGIIFYPWLYFCVLFLFGTNVIAAKTTFLLILSLICIKIYTFVFGSTYKVQPE
ncbi:TPA: oligosaccharide repeat unit polymerase [Klebsiella quasipneumoniae subsp. similipneumoniae]|uniref:O-antigen polymerase n=1 Tax=Klebsiella quasipneumoniae TaxID=1463165 RepID=UPI000DE5FF94|nr:O-antigen polymerase [Klebsiella quasipneumoniae]HBR1991676.1 oligosaccharide repeat unit polymerase [Klebsiella quasipneumoniae subsp. similipneumoniae]MCL1507103.1 oligosaccharide repeat unit polymerase [Klebsiella quasipneumoniae]QLP57533.1 oligosaccharide repeat unit polymerase [Klebsiella quasipneumoniae]USP86750.1 oligosaccharide repeat unit polymerase [Klebsiella quasipneumoniae]SSI00013.1 Uncharacterised protein [Klebsiella quasipneumoniae]